MGLSSSSGPFGGTGGELIGGRYEVMGLAGVGGMGSVYRVKDKELGVVVALKLLRRDFVAAPEMLDRFRREVALARRVTHDNVARVYDIGDHGDEKFLTMEFIEGESLAALAAREGALRVERVVDLVTAICRGLGAAHKAGIVHRDLKPDNVMLAADGRVVLTDFGVARAVVDSVDQTAGLALGTPSYMAPEQVEGVRDVDARADIYALGAMIYELVTGSRPWAGDSALAVAAARLVNPPPDPRNVRADVPDACARVVLKCMARRREDRYARAQDVAADLAQMTLPAAGAVSGSVTASGSVRVREGLAALAAPASTEKAVAILPFRNLGVAEDAYFTEGLTDDLIDSLSMTPGLKVRPHGAVAAYKDAQRDPREIGRELGVQVVVEGAMRRRPGAVRVSVRAISVADGFQIWAKRFDRPEQDLLLVDDEAARAIAAALTVDPRAPARTSATSTSAIELYLRARSETRAFDPENHARASALLREACELEPDESTFLSSYAISLARLVFFTGRGAELALEKAQEAVAKAPVLGEAHLALALARWHLGDIIASANAAREALIRAPGLAEAHSLVGRLLLEANRTEEGVRRIEVAIDLDPQSPVSTVELARVRAMYGEWDEVDRMLLSAPPSDRKFSYWIAYARLALWRGEAGYARRILSEIPADPGPTEIARQILRLVAGERDASAIEDLRGIARWTAAGGVRLRVFASQLEAELYAFAGRDADAVVSAEASIDAGLVDLLWMERCPVLDGPRRDPRWPRLRGMVEERANRILAALSGT